MEWRFKEGQKLLGDDDMGQMTFHKPARGLRAIAQLAFLDDLLEPAMVPQFRRVRIRGALHFYPMFGQARSAATLVGYRFDVVGDLADYDADARAMEAACGTGHVPPTGSRDPSGVVDPQGLNARASRRPFSAPRCARRWRPRSPDYDFEALRREPKRGRIAPALIAQHAEAATWSDLVTG